MAVRTLSGPGLAARAAALERPVVSLGGAVLALSLPLIFLHADYQPGFTLHAGSTGVSVYLSDLGNFQALNSIYGEYFGDHKPARSTVGVAQLPRGAAVEIDLVAVL